MRRCGRGCQANGEGARRPARPLGLAARSAAGRKPRRGHPPLGAHALGRPCAVEPGREVLEPLRQRGLGHVVPRPVTPPARCLGLGSLAFRVGLHVSRSLLGEATPVSATESRLRALIRDNLDLHHEPDFDRPFGNLCWAPAPLDPPLCKPVASQEELHEAAERAADLTRWQSRGSAGALTPPARIP